MNRLRMKKHALSVALKSVLLLGVGAAIGAPTPTNCTPDDEGLILVHRTNMIERADTSNETISKSLDARLTTRGSAATDFSILKVAETGDEPPGRPGATYDFLTGPTINNLGDVVFRGNYTGVSSGNQGIYRFRGNSLERIIDDGFDFSPPGQSGATSYTGFGPPATNDLGHVGFVGNFSFGDGNQGLYVFQGGVVERIFDNNPLDPVPGQPPSSTWSTFPFSAGLDAYLTNGGHSAAVANYFDAGFVERVGVFLGNTVTGGIAAASADTHPPGQAAGVMFSDFNWFMTLSDDGDPAFLGDYTGGLGTSGVYRFVLAEEELLRVADGSMAPPGQPGTARFTSFDTFPSMNSTNQIAFSATYTGGVGTRGIFRGDGEFPLETVIDNSGAFPVPGHPTKNFTLFGPPVMNGAGDVAFVAEFGAGPDDVGVFIKSGSQITNVFDLADPVPGQPGASFSLLGSHVLNASGQLAIAVRYTGGVGNEGVYFWDGAQFRRVLDESQDLFGRSPTNVDMMLGIGGSGGEDAKSKTLNDAGQITFLASFADGSRGIYRATPPVDCGPDVGMAMVDVGDPGNAPDTSGFGTVAIEFRIGINEVTNTQYVEFLNAVAAEDPNALYDPVMTTSLRGGILRFGLPGSYSYSVKPGFEDKPASGFSWAAGARFCNWLHNNKPSGAQSTTTTEDGAYNLSLPLEDITRNPGARWFLPSEDEWYKAAYYDPIDPGADAAGTPDYWLYPTRSDSQPTQAFSDLSGNILNPGPNVANFERGVDWNGTDCADPPAPCGNVSTVASAGSTSPWGAFDMGGNIYEWTETPGRTISGDPPLPTRVARGGDFANSLALLTSTIGVDINMQSGAANFGMRVASVICLSECPGDANGDGTIDVNDISYVLFRLGGPPPDGDANGDGTIDVNDVSFVLFRLGSSC